MTIIDRGRSSIQSSLDIRQNAPKKKVLIAYYTG